MPDPTTLTVTAAADAIRKGELASEALVRACLDRIAAREDDVQAWAHLDPELALAQAREADAALRSGGSHGRAARGAGRGQGHLRHRRHADRERLADFRWAATRARRDVRRRAARRRRRHHGQDGDDGARAADAGKDAQPAQSRTHPRRLVGRLGRRRRRPHGPRRTRQPDGRLDRAAGFILRRLWLQADARPRAACGRAHAIAHAGYGRPLRPLDRGPRAHHRLHDGVRRRRRDELPPQPPGPAWHGALQAADAAAAGIRQNAVLARCRRADARRVRNICGQPRRARRRDRYPGARRRHRMAAHRAACRERPLLRPAAATGAGAHLAGPDAAPRNRPRHRCAGIFARHHRPRAGLPCRRCRAQGFQRHRSRLRRSVRHPRGTRPPAARS